MTFFMYIRILAESAKMIDPKRLLRNLPARVLNCIRQNNITQEDIQYLYRTSNNTVKTKDLINCFKKWSEKSNRSKEIVLECTKYKNCKPYSGLLTLIMHRNNCALIATADHCMVLSALQLVSNQE